MTTRTFADWLKHERRIRGLTQTELEQQAGLSDKYVSRAENGRVLLPDEETRARIHLALGTSEDDLVAAGILERINSPYSDTPVYIAASSIRPLDRLVHNAPDSPYSAENDHKRLLTRLERLRLTTAQISALATILDAFEAANG